MLANKQKIENELLIIINENTQATESQEKIENFEKEQNIKELSSEPKEYNNIEFIEKQQSEDYIKPTDKPSFEKNINDMNIINEKVNAEILNNNLQKENNKARSDRENTNCEASNKQINLNEKQSADSDNLSSCKIAEKKDDESPVCLTPTRLNKNNNINNNINNNYNFNSKRNSYNSTRDSRDTKIKENLEEGKYSSMHSRFREDSILTDIQENLNDNYSSVTRFFKKDSTILEEREIESFRMNCNIKEDPNFNNIITDDLININSPDLINDCDSMNYKKNKIKQFLDKALQYKLQANEHFKKNRFNEAIKDYIHVNNIFF